MRKWRAASAAQLGAVLVAACYCNKAEGQYINYNGATVCLSLTSLGALHRIDVAPQPQLYPQAQLVFGVQGLVLALNSSSLSTIVLNGAALTTQLYTENCRR